MATIFCDTDCELWYTKAEELKLEVIQMPYTIDGEERLCDLGKDFDAVSFYNRMREGASVSTAGLNQEVYYDYFKPFFEKGEDILYIAFSSKLSGTFKYLELAINELKKEYPNVKYRQFDTLNICMGAGLLVYMAGKYCREHGDDIDATYEYLQQNVKNISVFFLVENMKFLARGGRISPAKAKIGNFLQIKPVLAVEDGALDVFEKANGLKKAYKCVENAFDQTYRNIDDAPVVIVDADNKQGADELENYIRENHPEVKEIWRQPIGPVIGVHAGPGAVGIIFTR